MNDFSVRRAKYFFDLYYSSHSSFRIPELKQRELAFSFFDKTGMARHTSFQSMGELADFIRTNTPLHFYYSSAYYGNPSAEMDFKEWKGADLIFDIDGDHIPNADKMTYGEMLGAVKNELMKLLFLLRDDFRINDDSMEIVFSGSRGYHVHVYSIFNDLGSQERREIVDYITGKCLLPDYGLKKMTAWSQRIESEKESMLSKIRKAKKWKEEFEKMTGRNIPDLEKKNDSRIERAIESAAKLRVNSKFSPLIDEPVTIDIHRLIRTPGGIHGKSGLMVMDVDPKKIDTFEPLIEAIPDEFKEIKERINVIRKSKVELGGEIIELSEGTQVLPLYGSIFLVLKGNAEFSEK